ncbi:MAG: adenylate/guanylate cyclase domain-containing protein [Candidatus Binatia bacterium]
MTRVTIAIMRGVSDFAVEVLQYNLLFADAFNYAAFAVTSAAIFVYYWPILRHSLAGYPAPAPELVRRRVLSAPLAVGLLCFFPWLGSIVFYVGVTYLHFGRWSPDLLSQHVLSPLVAGFLSSTMAYLLVERVVRTRFVPRVFPAGDISAQRGVLTLGVRARLLVLMLAVGFTPLFTMLGVVMAAKARASAGLDAAELISQVASASLGLFGFYVVLGVLLTLMLARSLTVPLGRTASALAEVQGGNLDVAVEVDSPDEVGLLGEGVNAMVSTLREREHILRAFGRVVEPEVRDRLLSGELSQSGELRVASVLFADLCGFTAMAEKVEPGEVVATLNGFFSVMGDWVHECGGFVDKFIGDAMMVVFGLFDESGDERGSAAAALRCARGMTERLELINGQRREAGLAELAVSIGVHSGEVLAGMLGADERHEYTVIGDAVNVAARLQQLCRERGASLLASAQTIEAAGLAGTETVAEERVRLRGRSEDLQVFTLA